MTRTTAAWPFAISTLFVGDRVDVRVGGSLDTTTGPLLRSALANLADDGHVLVTLDLAEVEVMDAAGARAIAYMAARLHGLNTRLTVRGASTRIRDTLHLGALDSLIDFTPGGRRVPDARESGSDERATTMAARLVLNRIGPGGQSFAVVDAALRLVTSLAQVTVSGADGVSVSLHRHGALMTVAASDDRIAQMDRDQYATGEGPCLTAAAEGLTVEVRALEHETRWPAFVPLAQRGGIASILSSPLKTSAGPIGALNMYSRSVNAFDAPGRTLAALFAEQASGILTEAHGASDGRPSAEHLHHALVARSVIAQAQGILMARTGGSAEGAAADLRRSARQTERSVRAVADETIAAASSDDNVRNPDA